MNLNIKDAKAADVCFALSNKTRRKILAIVSVFDKLSISALAAQLAQTEAGTSYNVSVLERAGLIRAKYKPGRHGVAKTISLAIKTLIIHFKEEPKEGDAT